MPGDNRVRKRPDLWSYLSFGSGTSRSSSDYSLPSHSGARGFDKTHSRGHSRSNGSMSGTGPYTGAAMSHGQRVRYLKYAGVLAGILLVFWMFAPSKYTGYSPGVLAPDGTKQVASCERPYDASKPLKQYALMIDAGSTGSRIHAYRFNNCGPTPELEDEMFEQTIKKEGAGSGLSSYDADSEGAARSLDPLLRKALNYVPKRHHKCTPIAVKATAGLRKLGQEKSARILEQVRARLEKEYPFPVIAASNGGVEVMDGTDEGVYGWITVNYLLGKIGTAKRRDTAAVFDLGGGSTQIVYEPAFPTTLFGGETEELTEGEHKYRLEFGGRNITLYQHSYLGYGLMAARENIHKQVVHEALANTREKITSTREFLESTAIDNPCIAPGMTRTVKVDFDSSSNALSSVMVSMKGNATGSTERCRAIAEKTLKRGADCAQPPCSFNGVHQPSLDYTFSENDVYLISYFYDRTAELGMPSRFKISDLQNLAARVCEGERGWTEFYDVKGALSELRGRPEACLDLSFMVSLLLDGYGFKPSRSVRVAKKIGANELGWCLGASLPLLNEESGWTCKIEEI